MMTTSPRAYSDPDGPILLRPDAMAELLSLSTQRLAKMRLEGCGPPYVKLGRSVLYPRGGAETWLAKRTQRSTSDTIRDVA